MLFIAMHPYCYNRILERPIDLLGGEKKVNSINRLKITAVASDY